MIQIKCNMMKKQSFRFGKSCLLLENCAALFWKQLNCCHNNKLQNLACFSMLISYAVII